jgi:hypothetical protein
VAQSIERVALASGEVGTRASQSGKAAVTTRAPIADLEIRYNLPRFSHVPPKDVT